MLSLGTFLEILSQFLVQQLILKQYQILTLLETSEQLDFGLDAKLFDSRLGMTLDWYKKNNQKLVGSSSILELLAPAPLCKWR
jgi:hypothetical protein